MSSSSPVPRREPFPINPDNRGEKFTPDARALRELSHCVHSPQYSSSQENSCLGHSKIQVTDDPTSRVVHVRILRRARIPSGGPAKCRASILTRVSWSFSSNEASVPLKQTCQKRFLPVEQYNGIGSNRTPYRFGAARTIWRYRLHETRSNGCKVQRPAIRTRTAPAVFAAGPAHQRRAQLDAGLRTAPSSCYLRAEMKIADIEAPILVRTNRNMLICVGL